MSTIENHFMKEHFNNLLLRPALFYAWEYSIRFEISMPFMEHDDKNNLQQILERSTSIFDNVFQETDEILLITDILCGNSNTFLQKRPTKVYQKYVKDKKLLKKLQHNILPNVNPYDDEDITTHRFMLSCKKSDIRHQELLSAISYEDYSHPTRILKNNYQVGCEIYFVNVTRKIIYHLYDDRGCDVIASNKENLRSLYLTYNDWILDYDRNQIDQLFQ